MALEISNDREMNDPNHVIPLLVTALVRTAFITSVGVCALQGNKRMNHEPIIYSQIIQCVCRCCFAYDSPSSMPFYVYVCVGVRFFCCCCVCFCKMLLFANSIQKPFYVKMLYR